VRHALVLCALAACGRIDFVTNQIGCADGTREAFADPAKFPTIAGCAVTWTGMIDLRSPDAAAFCAADWHVCGLTGDPTELSSRATVDECDDAGGAGTGAYVVAMQHCSTTISGCTYTTPYGCPANRNACSQSACCGPDCGTFNDCKAGIYPDPLTRVSPNAMSDGCGATSNDSITGVLCCL
jgi:hypothetical protein